MELRELQYFEAVAHHGHFGRAAEALCLTQPAVTKAINRLEESLGARLFDRLKTGAVLTPAGKAVLKQAERVRRAVEDTVKQAQEYTTGASGHIRIGAAPTMAQYLLPSLCRHLLEKSAGLTLEARIGTSRRLRQLLEAGEVDLLLGPIHPLHPELSAVPVVEDHVVVVAAREHPIFDRPRIQLADLLAYEWVLPFSSDATEERDWLNGVFRSKHLDLPRVQIETDSVTLLPRLIAETQLLSFITRRNLGVGRIGAPLREVPLQTTTLTRHFGILYKRDGYLSPATKHVVDIVTESGRTLFTS